MNKVCLKIDAADSSNASFLTKAICKNSPDFTWDFQDYTLEEWNALLGVLKISASSDPNFKGDCNWPPISVFLKDEKKKSLVWEDIQTRVIPYMKSSPVKKLEEIVITSLQLQRLMTKLSDSNLKFSLDLPDGRFLSVNKNPSEQCEEGEIAISTSDIASMLAASWLFKSNGVKI